MPEIMTPANTRSKALSVRNLSVDRGGKRILEGVSFSVFQGAPFAIVGESGSGKTTLLLSALGLIPIESGRVEIYGQEISGAGTRDRARLAGLVFQDYQLFPHLTAFENVTLACRFHGIDGYAEKARALLAKLKIDGLASRYSHELSGGQKQRVAIARSLVLGPRVLFFDEPSAALDQRTSIELASLLKELGLQTQVVIVSHDYPFIEACCESGLRLDEGRKVTEGNLKELLAWKN